MEAMVSWASDDQVASSVDTPVSDQRLHSSARQLHHRAVSVSVAKMEPSTLRADEASALARQARHLDPHRP